MLDSEPLYKMEILDFSNGLSALCYVRLTSHSLPRCLDFVKMKGLKARVCLKHLSISVVLAVPNGHTQRQSEPAIKERGETSYHNFIALCFS